MEGKCKYETTDYWRELQRDQLGVAASVFYVSASACLGFVMNYLLAHPTGCLTVSMLIVSSVFLVISWLLYCVLVLNRLCDFRETARLYKENKSRKEIEELTRFAGKRTWFFLWAQVCTLVQGGVFALIGFYSAIC